MPTASLAPSTLTPAKPTETRIPELDGLRGLAILMVIGTHYLYEIPHGEFGTLLYKSTSAFRLGWAGVDLFFVLSGFLIGGILLEARASSNYFKTFYLRRVHRIFPIYFLCIAIYLALHWLAGGALQRLLPVDPRFVNHLPLYVLFLQNFYVITPPRTLEWYWFVPMWSLAVEEQFYLLAPPVIRFLPPARLKRVLLITIVCALLLRTMFLLFWPAGAAAIYNWMPCRADSLAIGILAAILWRDGTLAAWYQRNPARFRRVVLLFTLPLLPCIKWLYSQFSPWMATVGYTWLALMFAGWMSLALCERQGRWAGLLRAACLREMGRLSYCIYLFHFGFLVLLHALLLHAPPRVGDFRGAAVTLLAFVATFLFAKISWHAFEEPLLRRAHRFRYT